MDGMISENGEKISEREVFRVRFLPMTKALSTLSQKSQTVGEKWGCCRKVRLSQKSATICRGKVRLWQKSETVAEFRRCLAVFGDSRTFLRQCGRNLFQPIYQISPWSDLWFRRNDPLTRYTCALSKTYTLWHPPPARRHTGPDRTANSLHNNHIYYGNCTKRYIKINKKK